MSRYIPIPCRGCLSFPHWCRRYTATTTSSKDHRRFREGHCPCRTCIVKPICSDPKVATFSYDIYDLPRHKCKILYLALREFAGLKKVKNEITM